MKQFPGSVQIVLASPKTHSQPNILEGREGTQEVKRLKDVADFGVFERFAIEQDFSRVNWNQPGDHVDQRGLATAVGAEHRNNFVLRDVEVKILVQRPTRKILGQATDGDVGARRAGPESRHRHIGKHRRVEDFSHLPLQ